MSTTIYTTEEEKAEAFRVRKNEAAKRMLDRKAEAMSKLIALALRSGNAEEKEAARYLEPGRHLNITPKTPIISMIEADGSVHEDEIFKKFKMGRKEMRAIMKTNDSIKFDIEACTYSYKA